MNEKHDQTPSNAAMSQAALVERQSAPIARTRWKSWLLLCVIFAAGVAIGAAGAMKIIHYRVRTLLLHPDRVPDQVVEGLRHRLSLTEPQAHQVTAIIRRRHATLEALRAEVSPRIATELTQLRTEVADVLTSDQLPHWQVFCSRLDALTASPTKNAPSLPD